MGNKNEKWNATDNNTKKKLTPREYAIKAAPLADDDFEILSAEDAAEIAPPREAMSERYIPLHAKLPKLKVGQAIKVDSKKLPATTIRGHLHKTLLLQDYLSVTETEELTIIKCLKELPEDFLESICKPRKAAQIARNKAKRAAAKVAEKTGETNTEDEF